MTKFEYKLPEKFDGLAPTADKIVSQSEDFDRRAEEINAKLSNCSETALSKMLESNSSKQSQEAIANFLKVADLAVQRPALEAEKKAIEQERTNADTFKQWSTACVRTAMQAINKQYAPTAMDYLARSVEEIMPTADGKKIAQIIRDDANFVKEANSMTRYSPLPPSNFVDFQRSDVITTAKLQTGQPISAGTMLVTALHTDTASRMIQMIDGKTGQDLDSQYAISKYYTLYKFADGRSSEKHFPNGADEIMRDIKTSEDCICFAQAYRFEECIEKASKQADMLIDSYISYDQCLDKASDRLLLASAQQEAIALHFDEFTKELAEYGKTVADVFPIVNASMRTNTPLIKFEAKSIPPILDRPANEDQDRLGFEKALRDFNNAVLVDTMTIFQHDKENLAMKDQTAERFASGELPKETKTIHMSLDGRTANFGRPMGDQTKVQDSVEHNLDEQNDPNRDTNDDFDEHDT